MVEILIIGAGAAGIAAATKLIENGFTCVKILEAENRIGGRIHSIFLGDAFVDLGAEEVHGEEGNILVQLAGKYLKKKSSLTNSTCYYSNGKQIDAEICSRIMKFIEEFSEEDSKAQKSIGEAFIERYNSAVLSSYKDDPQALKKANEFLPLCESFFSILEGPFSWFDAVLVSGSHYINCGGDQFMGWTGHGCKTILDVLRKKIPNKEDQVLFDDQILLNKSVKKILWDCSNKVEIKCADGSNYSADHVIFTPSIGVLRDQHRDLFEPNLPEEKKSILQRVGFANVMKVALKFSKKWWSGTPFGIVWSKEDREAVKLDYGDKSTAMEGDSWLTAVHWLMDTPDNDQVLVAWLTGPATPRIERLNNEEIKNGLMYVIRKFLSKDFDIEEPDVIVTSRWKSNPNFLGTYSYETIEASKMEVPFQVTLEQPLINEKGIPRVLFAGEATHLTQYSTVNGAILSGYRESNRIIEMYKDE